MDEARFYSRSHYALIGIYDEAGYVIDTHEQAGHFGDVVSAPLKQTNFLRVISAMTRASVVLPLPGGP